MIDETAETLVASGDLIFAEDVVFVIDMVTALIDRAAETERDHFVSLGMAVLEMYRESLTTLNLDESDKALDIVMGRP